MLLGFALRVTRLEYQSLWYDETYAVHAARGSLGAVGSAPEADPLLYYYLLWLWGRAAGFGEYAVRYLSVIGGVLMLPVTYRLALAGLRRTAPALLTTGLLAISPFAVHYSQEARLHIFAGCLAASCTWALLAAVRQPNWRRWLTYSGLCVAGLYTSYYLALLLAAINLPVLLRRRWSKAWLAANASTVAVALPGIVLALIRLRAFAEPYPVIPAFLSPVRFLASTPATILLANLPATAQPLAWLAIAVALYGAWRALSQRTMAGSVLASSGILAYAAIFALPAALGISYYDRYELMALPGLIILVAAGAWFAARWFPWSAPPLAALLLLPAAAGLFNGFTNGAYQRDDNRTALNLVKQQAVPDEVLIYDLPLLYDVVEYYARDLPIPSEGLPIPKNRQLPRDRQFAEITGDREATDQELERLSQRYAGFWLLLSGDPTHWTEDWLDAHRLPVLNRWFGGTRLVHFRPLPSPAPAVLLGAMRVDKSFGPLQLRQVRAPELTPGHAWPLYLAWEASSPPRSDLTVSLQLFDGSGKRIAQHDGQPFEGALPTSRWQPGMTYQDVASLEVPAALPAGLYGLAAATYDRTAGAPTQTLAVLPYGLRPLEFQPVTASPGWTTDKVQGSALDGEYVVAVQGRVQTRPAADYTWFVHLLDASGQLIAQDDHPPIAPTSSWQSGDSFLETFRLTTTPSAGSQLEIGAYDTSGRRATFQSSTGPTDHLIVSPTPA